MNLGPLKLHQNAYSATPMSEDLSDQMIGGKRENVCGSNVSPCEMKVVEFKIFKFLMNGKYILSKDN